MAERGRTREPRNGGRLTYGPDEFARDLGLEVSRETLERLEFHRRLLEEWSARMNLIGPKELEHFWRRHALDSAQLVRLAPEAKRWLDLGSGAGLPGLVIAAFMAEESDASVHLVESTGKKAAFLRAVAEGAALPVRVFNQRIEDFGLGEGAYEVVTARALAPLPRLILYAKPFLDRGAQGLFHKGADTDAELAAANDVLNGASGVSYRADVLGSLSDPRGRIVRVVRGER